MVTLYEYYKNLCVCPGQDILIGMFDLQGNEVGEYPVMVLNINEVPISAANDKASYISIWNSDPENIKVGELSGGEGLFVFTFSPRPRQPIPSYVLGDTGSLIPDGALADQDGSLLVDIGDSYLVDN